LYVGRGSTHGKLLGIALAILPLSEFVVVLLVFIHFLIQRAGIGVILFLWHVVILGHIAANPLALAVRCDQFDVPFIPGINVKFLTLNS
jgi:hypothetical protein